MHDQNDGGRIAAALLAVMALEPLHVFTGAPVVGIAAHVAMGAVVLASWRRLGLREAYLLALSAVLGALVWMHAPAPAEVMIRALDQAVFLMAFILLVSLLQEGAMTSASVEAVGTYLARQPGGRRYTALYAGTNVLAVVFNMGTLSLFAPLIRRAAEAAPDDPLTPLRERRQLTALLRGFAWAVVWSPTAIAPLALLGLIDGIDRGLWIGLGLVLSALMLPMGWVEDRLRWQRRARALGGGRGPRPMLPLAALWRFLAVCAAFGGMTYAVIGLTDVGIPPGLMVSAPVILAFWLAAQAWRSGEPVLTGIAARARSIRSTGLPQSAPLSVTLACSGFVGIAGAALVPAEALAARLGFETMPAWIFMLGTTLAVLAFSQMALSPVMMAVFFGAVLGSLPALPASPTLTALAVATGWAVATTFSPFASGAIFLARISGHPGTRLTYRWNGPFTGFSVLILAGAYWIMAQYF